VKKVRAILEAVEADNGRGTGNAAKRLHRINRVLSPLRDADAMITTLAKLRSRNPRLFTEHTFARVRRELSLRKRKAMTAVERENGWEKLDRELRALRASARRWWPAHHGFRALDRAMRATHRRGRRALADAERTQDAAAFHEWRKQIKALWYELRLLEKSGGVISRYVRALQRAESCLGDEHNVVVLCAELSKDASVCAGPLDVDRLRLAADRYQCELRGKALTSARPIYARKSRDYVRSVEQTWKTGRHNGRRRAGRGAAA
jgi:CHAD domain-containing protein